MSEEIKPWGAPISAKKATEKINRYQKEYPNQTKSCAFPADTIIRLGDQLKKDKELTKAVFFLGMGDDGLIDLIVYPANEKGQLRSVTLSESNRTFAEEGGPTGDNATQQCPPFCNCPPDDPNCDPS